VTPVPPVDHAAIARAADVLARGGLVAMPTETVYGLAADAENESAVRAIFAAKGRPADHPVIVHVAAGGDPAAALDLWGVAVPEFARTLARAFWPGPLTLVVRRSARARDVITGGQDTVGLRAPSHPWAQALLAALAARNGHAIAAPSANSFGRISPTTAAHVRADLGERPAGRVDVILDGGPCPVGIESTIVDCSGAEPRLLRPGAITRAQLTTALVREIAAPADAAPRVSGSLPSHYAPRTPLELVDPEDLPARLAALRGSRIAVLAPGALSTAAFAQVVARRIAPDSVSDYAHDLYASLHVLDAAGAQRLLIARPPAGAQWEAIHDRLNRAAAGGGVAALDDAD
jgi:L-threonylcarbamoyladenylate synthase